jgi:hypothetical protein
MIALIIDMEISNVAHLIDERISSDTGIIIFTLVSLTYCYSGMMNIKIQITKGN